MHVTPSWASTPGRSAIGGRRRASPLRFVLMLALAVWPAGCVSIQPTRPPIPEEPPRSLPFKVRLAEGEPDDLPPMVAASLSDKSPVTFSYREDLGHEHHTVPLWISAFNPLTFFGAPTGSTAVTAFAQLVIRRGDTILGDYAADARVSADYGLTYGTTNLDLDRAALAEVRRKIDDELARDSIRLAQRNAASSRQQPD
jgi:hypothetical protein